MYKYHLQDMAKRLAEANVIESDQIEKAVAVMEEEWQDKIAISWAADDIITRAEETLAIDISEEHARDILQELLHKFDANYGINWDIIDFLISEWKRNQLELSA